MRHTNKIVEAKRKLLYKQWKQWDIDDHLIDLNNGKSKSNNKTIDIDVPLHQKESGMRTGLSLLLNADLRIADPECKSIDGSGFRVN